jgi:hypothetical protein
LTSDAYPNCASFVAGTGGFRFDGRPDQFSASERSFGAIFVDSPPAVPSSPARGVGNPPNGYHGDDVLRSSSSDCWASARLTGSGLEPPSMYTSPASPFAPGLPLKSQVA